MNSKTRYFPTFFALFIAAARVGADPQPALTLDENGAPIVSWQRAADESYDLQTSPELDGWTNQPSLPEVSPDGSTLFHRVGNEVPDQERGFYRLNPRPSADQLTVSETPLPVGVPQIITLVDGGQLRRYRLYLPPTYSAPPVADRRCDDGYPLAIICHGSGQTAGSFAALHPDLITKCAIEEVVLVMPQGTWNAEAGKHSFNSLDDRGRRDDVGLVVRIAAQLQEALWIDRDCIYIGGFSNGGIHAQRSVARAPGTFAAFTAIGAALGGQSGGDLSSPIIRVPEPLDTGSAPALIVSGRIDLGRPFHGGQSNGTGSLQTPAIEMPRFWAGALRCEDPFVTTNILTPGGMLAGRLESACAGTPREVLFVDLERMAHFWPDAADSVGWDANIEVIDFFLSHERGAIADPADPAPVTAPASWVSTSFSGSDVVYHVPTAPAAMVFLAHDNDENIRATTDIEMVEILEGLSADGIGFFATTPSGATWDLTDSDPATNADLRQALDLHAHLVSTTDLDPETFIVPMGVGEGGHFALLAGEHLDLPGSPVGGVAMLGTPIGDTLPTLVASALEQTGHQLYFTNGENDDIAPPLPAWEEYRRLSVYSGSQKQQVFTDFFPGRRKTVAAGRFTRVPSVSAAQAAGLVAALETDGVIDASGEPLVCPGEVDCASYPLPAGFSPVQEEQLRKQLCAALAGPGVDATALPSLRHFCIGARRLLDPPPPPLPSSAPADSTPVDPVPSVPWSFSGDVGGLPVRAYIPANPVALTYFFHGTSGGIDFYERIEQYEMIHALFDAGFGVVCAVSEDRDNLKSPKAQWDTRPLHPDTDAVYTDNVDWVRMMTLRDQLITATNLTTTTPLFSLGFSNGGSFALTFGFLAQQAGLDFRGAAVHAQPGFDTNSHRAARRLATGTPIFLTALANDNTAAKIPTFEEMLRELGHQTELHLGDELLLKPDRFQRIPGINAAASQQIFDSLVNTGVIDSSGLRTVPVGAPLPAAVTDDMNKQIRSTIYSDHVFSARFLAEEIAWFEAQLP